MKGRGRARQAVVLNASERCAALVAAKWCLHPTRPKPGQKPTKIRPKTNLPQALPIYTQSRLSSCKQRLQRPVQLLLSRHAGRAAPCGASGLRDAARSPACMPTHLLAARTGIPLAASLVNIRRNTVRSANLASRCCASSKLAWVAREKKRAALGRCLGFSSPTLEQRCKAAAPGGATQHAHLLLLIGHIGTFHIIFLKCCGRTDWNGRANVAHLGLAPGRLGKHCTVQPCPAAHLMRPCINKVVLAA